MRYSVALFFVFLVCEVSAQPLVVTVNEPQIPELPSRAATFAMPVSQLRLLPQVDLQSRNLPEAQGEVVIRGGTFESATIQLGGISLFDPQTGHYLAELPIDPLMLSQAQVTTGARQALSGVNGTVGGIAWGFSPLDRTRARAEGGIGSDSTFVGSLYGGVARDDGLSADVSVARSQTDGTRVGGDAEFERITARIQQESELGTTTLLAGYQEKDFHWPYLYALEPLHDLVGASGIEGELLRTTLVLLNHHFTGEYGTVGDIAVAYRHHRDDYDFDARNPALFNPFRHTTDFFAVGGSGRHGFSEDFGLRYGAQYTADDIESTSLTFGPFDSRSYYHIALAPELIVPVGERSSATFFAGVSYDDTNRDREQWSPMGGVTLREGDAELYDEVYAEIAQSSQVAGYTARASNPAAGLFRGNPDLDRTVSTNYEIGYRLGREQSRGSLALFFREDDDLTDWVFRSGVQPFAARSAAEVDVETTGVELGYHFSPVNRIVVEGGYTYLHRATDFESEGVDASFYAGNIPRHRVVAALSYFASEELTLLWAQEVRNQYANALRDTSDTTFARSGVAIEYTPQPWNPVTLRLSAENIFNEQFEEVPGVPGVGRVVLASVRWEFLR